MDIVLRHRGREVSDEDVAFIRELIARHPDLSRRRLSAELCRAWDWRQPNGALRDMLCRGLMLALHRSGHVELPPVRLRPPNPFVTRARRRPVEVDSTPIHGSLSELWPLDFQQVRRTAAEAVHDGLIESHHPLGYTQPVGEHLKYLVTAGEREVACSRSARRRATSVHVTVSSAGRSRRVGATATCSPTTRGSWCCRG